MDHRKHKAESAKPHLPVLQTVKKHYATAVDYYTYLFCNRFFVTKKTVSSYIAKMVMKFKSRVNAYSINPKSPISTIEFPAASKLVFVTNRIHKGAST